jgi:YYY domain-containing protein
MSLDLLAWWALLAALGWSVMPVLERLLPGFADRGLAFAKPLALVILGYVSWLATSAGVPHPISLGLAAGLLAAVGAVGRSTLGRRIVGTEARIPAGEIWRAEAAFAGAFLFFALVRALLPDIFGAEKYMDFAFFNTLLRARHFPAEDPWLAGLPVNYYDFGYLLFANAARIVGVAPEAAYNLSLATIGAFLFTGAASISRRLAGSFPLGLAGGVAAAILGNLDGGLQVIVERRWLGIDYWRSSRVVPNTINEFPFFSLLHGDLHPHVTALVIDLVLYALVVAGPPIATRGAPPGGRTRWDFWRWSVGAVLVAALYLTNPWDLPVAFTFLGIVWMARLRRQESLIRAAVMVAVCAATLAGAALVLSLPFALRFDAPFRGFGLVHQWTPPGAFLIVFGFLLLPPAIEAARAAASWLPGNREVREFAAAAALFAALALYVSGAHVVLIGTLALAVASSAVLLDPATEEDRVLPFACLATAALALFACEVVYLRDSYGEAFHRMNTVFKLYFQAWIFLAIALPWFTRRLVVALEPRPLLQGVAGAVLTAGLIGSLCYPVATIAGRARDLQGGLSLDGLRYLARDHPGDFAAIDWLRRTADGRPVVLEATGDPYSYYARVSSNTGLPTVLGWANHEGVWRGNDAGLDARRRDVETLYTSDDVARVRPLLKRHRIRFVFVGDLERERHTGPGLEKFARHPEIFESVFRSGTTTVYAVR